jgi:hypothetical protein
MTWECDYTYNLVTGKDWKCKEQGKCESWHEPTQGHFDYKHITCAQLGSVQFINFNIKLSTFCFTFVVYDFTLYDSCNLFKTDS